MIERVLAPNPGLMTGAGTNTYLVSSVGHVAIIDPGPDDAEHVAAILGAAAALGAIQAVLVTHHHLDHLPAARHVCDASDAPLYGHRLLPGVERALGDGETVALGELRLTALETPGHTSDSLCFWIPPDRALFTGDLVAGAGTVVVDEARGALAQYVNSIERLLTLGSSTIYPGHGPRVDDGQAKLEEYLAHRRQREQQVLLLLDASSPRSVEALVDAMYPDLVAALVPMAARNVRAHLAKLSDEGRAAESPAGWVI